MESRSVSLIVVPTVLAPEVLCRSHSALAKKNIIFCWYWGVAIQVVMRLWYPAGVAAWAISASVGPRPVRMFFTLRRLA